MTESSAAIDYSAQRSQSVQSTDYIVPEPNNHPGIYIAQGDAACNLTNSLIRQSLPWYDKDNLDIEVSWPSKVVEESWSIDEIAVWHRLLDQQRELDLMNLSRTLKQLRYTEKYLAFTEQLILKQETQCQFPNLEDDRPAPARMNQEQSRGYCSTSPMEEELKEIDSLEPGSPMDWQSEIPSAQLDLSKTDQQQEPTLKARHCRHFLKGRCDRGESCGFRHDYSLFCTDKQKVFLRGLPKHLNSRLLRQKLSEQGYTVLNNPKIHRWYSPQVCLGSIAEAKRLVKQGTILIDGAFVRVRPFKAFRGDGKKKFPDEVRRSVFLGGLAPNTTAKMIRDQIGRRGFVVVNIPVVKSGYCRKVVLETFEQAQTLLRLSFVEINESIASVRPFANMRRSSGKRAKRNMRSINQSK